jgi:hypothetical protein
MKKEVIKHSINGPHGTTVTVGSDDSPATQLRALQSCLGKEAFTGAMDKMIEQEDF